MRQALQTLARSLAVALVAVLGLPVALLIPASLLDRGPSGAIRGSLFPLALALLDPYVWTCARNSLIVAAIVTGLALAIGVPLARAVGPWRFWGRPPLVTLAWLPLATPPAVAALGMVSLVSTSRLARRLATGTGWSMPVETPWDVWFGWGLLVWAEVASAAVLVAWSTTAALSRVDPAWADMGRALGASRRATWRQLVWPVVRPEVARTLAAVFAIGLLDPGAPIVLGLRRTLPHLIVETVHRGDPPTRAAALGLIGLGLALLGRLLIRAWGGPRIDVDPRRFGRPARASVVRTILSAVGLIAWSAIGLAPLAGLVGIVVGATSTGGGEGWIIGLTTVVYRLFDPDTTRIWGNSLLLGAGSTALAAVVVAGLGRPAGSRRRGGFLSLPVLAFERTPPLVFGLAMGAVPALLAMAGDGLALPSLARFAGWLEPVRWPGLLMIAATAAARLPTLARAADRAAIRSRPELVDAALGLGASRRRAIRLGGGRGPGRGVLVLTFALATTSVAPALVLAPSMRTRPVGAAVVLLAEDRARAAALGLGIAGLNAFGLVAARRGRTGPAGDWLRG